MKAKKKILALHESVRPALLDELIKRFDRVRVTTNPSAKDIRYTLDYIVNWYMVGYMTGSDSFNPERQLLSSHVQLIVQDVLKDETVLDQVLVITQDFSDGLKFSMIFTKKRFALWHKKCRRCLIENAHIRR